jgi:hypothetical protein
MVMSKRNAAESKVMPNRIRHRQQPSQECAGRILKIDHQVKSGEPSWGADGIDEGEPAPAPTRWENASVSLACQEEGAGS